MAERLQQLAFRGVGIRGDGGPFGLGGDDAIAGGRGNDLMGGTAGRDRPTGGEDNDVFVFGEGHGRDVVTDFDALSPTPPWD